MKKKILIWTIIQLIFGLSSGCSQNDSNQDKEAKNPTKNDFNKKFVKDFNKMAKSLYKGTVPLIQPKTLHKELKQKQNSVILLDAREEREYQVSHLKNARYIGYKKFNMELLKNIPKESKIVVYCSLGYRSERIGEKLKAKGYNNVYNLYGGIFKWVNNHYKVYDKDTKETDKVHAYSKKWGKWVNKGTKVYK